MDREDNKNFTDLMYSSAPATPNQILITNITISTLKPWYNRL